MTFLAKKYHEEGRTIYSNYHLKNVPYKSMTLKEMAELPDELTNAVVLMDELHVGVDSYDFMKSSSKAFYTFATQLRKRKVNWYYTTQIFTQVAKRIRMQTDYLITMENTKKEHLFKVHIYDRRKVEGANDPINQFTFDGSDYFDDYDTDEVIQFGEED
jgi:DNA polymerase III delta prime subunit